MLHKKVNLSLTVKDLRPETPHYFSVVFERPRGFTFQAGDWMDLALPPADIPGGRTYSFSSSPTEPDLVITLRQGVSPIKRALAGLQPGDRLLMTQYGNAYDFHLKQHKASTLIAGGIGIAPFRSMLKELVDEGGRADVRLLYFNHDDSFIFAGELNAWHQQQPGLDIRYVVTRDLARKDRAKLIGQAVANDSRHYYIAGPPEMVYSTITVLRTNGITDKQILLDSFDGYQ